MDTSASGSIFSVGATPVRVRAPGPVSAVLETRCSRPHMSKCKGCRGSEVKKITVMTRPGDVIAGGSGGMGPAAPTARYNGHIPDIYLVYIKSEI